MYASQDPARPGEGREDDDALVYPAPWDVDSTLSFDLLCSPSLSLGWFPWCRVSVCVPISGL